MICVICLDPKDGCSFGNRRQSKDRLLRQKLLELCAGSPLWMSPYSAGQFEKVGENFRIAENCLELAGPGELCFAEAVPPESCLSRTEELIVFRWDKCYPASAWFSPLRFSRKPPVIEEFPGYSHEIITMERYLP